MAWKLNKIGEDVLKLQEDLNAPFYLSWSNITVDVNDNYLKFSQDGVVHNGRNEIKFLYTDVSNITATSAPELMEKVVMLFQSVATASIITSQESAQTADNTFLTHKYLMSLIELQKKNNDLLKLILS
jgi:hypothetical protein